MQRSWSMTRVADEYYKNLLSKSPSSSFSSSTTSSSTSDDVNVTMMYTPGSPVVKREKSRLRSAENAVHLIPLVLLLCAIILCLFSSNPTGDVINTRPVGKLAKIEGLKLAGGTDIDGTQNNLMPHVELEDVDLLHHHLHHQHQHQYRRASGRKPSV